MSEPIKNLRILVTGSREWTAESRVRHAITRAWSEHRSTTATIVHGGNPAGADAAAQEISYSMGGLFSAEVHKADFYPDNIESFTDAVPDTKGVLYRPDAGPERNSLMVELGADICLAFIIEGIDAHTGKEMSRGTKDCADKAELAGIRTVRFVLRQDALDVHPVVTDTSGAWTDDGVYVTFNDSEATPDLDVFLRAYNKDDNVWWGIGSGHHQNLFDAAVARMEEAEARVAELLGPERGDISKGQRP